MLSAEPGQEREIAGLSPGACWVALLGVDEAGEWYVGSAEGTLGPGLPSEWVVQTHPLREVRAQVRLAGAGTQAKVWARSVPGAESRFARFSSFRSSQSLNEVSRDDVSPELPPGGTPSDAQGALSLRLPPGRWELRAQGPAGTAGARAEVLIPPSPGPALEVPLELVSGQTREFSLSWPDGPCELALSAPFGAWVEALGSGRYRVGGLRPDDEVWVFALARASEAEGAPISGASLRLVSGAPGVLVFQPCARLAVGGLPGEPGEVTLRARDAGCAPLGHAALAWSLSEEFEPGPRWLEEPVGSHLVILGDFPRSPGREARALVDGAQRCEFEALFPGPVELRLEGPDGLKKTRRLDVLPGQKVELSWSE